MKKLTLVVLAGILFYFVCACADNFKLSVTSSWKVSTESRMWQDGEQLIIMKGGGENADIEIDPVSQRQEISGFGGAFNEKGWVALSLLTPEKRDQVLKELFDPETGAKFNICRVPIGASDYAVSRYTHNGHRNDYKMINFSIAHDRKYLLPYIKAAMKYRPDLKVWGSDWTPPTWMKTSGEYDGGNMKDDPKIYAAYALYLARFVEEYRKEGIDLFAVAVQNEPECETHYPSCLWTPEQFLTFIRDYMGPLFEERKLNAEIMLGTIQDSHYNQFTQRVMIDPKARKYVNIIGFQWEAWTQVSVARDKFPEMHIMQTETECGNCHWKPGFDMNKPQNDWAYGSYTWKKIKAYFDEGVNSYMLWNMVLDEEGKNIDAKLPWPQNAAVVVDKTTKQVIYTPMFYAFKHFSYFVKPGAYYVDVIEGADNAIAFMNPGGELIIVIENKGHNTKPIEIKIGGYRINAELPEASWSTIVVPPLQ